MTPLSQLLWLNSTFFNERYPYQVKLYRCNKMELSPSGLFNCGNREVAARNPKIVFENLQDHIQLSLYLSYVSGALVGCAATVGSYPFDLQRTMLASQGEPKSSLNYETWV
ncbi:hypothetical protein SO802_033602 [Lithocarpus litseifolius]|uniref:Uncharacterized protein n=1 Tax=Lithocarpus litseifolius TaxID=425828 RepID=A0AAW2BFH0_9ROSI